MLVKANPTTPNPRLESFPVCGNCCLLFATSLLDLPLSDEAFSKPFPFKLSSSFGTLGTDGLGISGLAV